jgi:hypothetical protein
MSKTFFVKYRQRGFWAYDVALNVFLKHLIDVARPLNAGSNSDWLTQGIHDWRVTIAAHECGKVIDENWNQPQLAAFVELANQACDLLAERETIGSDEILTWDFGDGVRAFTRGAVTVETAPIIELGRAIIALIDGTLLAPPPDTAWIFGTPNGRDVIPMVPGYRWDSLD